MAQNREIYTNLYRLNLFHHFRLAQKYAICQKNYPMFEALATKSKPCVSRLSLRPLLLHPRRELPHKGKDGGVPRIFYGLEKLKRLTSKGR